jgi:hypothetical protein
MIVSMSDVTGATSAAYYVIGNTVYFVVSNADYSPPPPPDPQVLKDLFARTVLKRNYSDLIEHAGCLRYLYRSPCKRFQSSAFKAPRVIRQPCWSAKRWRSLT